MANNGQSRALQEIRDAVMRVSREQDADIILYSGDIRLPNYENLVQLVTEFHEKSNVMLLLTTNGGNPDSAYRIARFLQKTYAHGKFIVFITSWCKSAGTLLTIGADEVVMCEMAELGPLDVQFSKPDALAEQMSGLAPSQAITTLYHQAFEAMEDFFLKLRFRSGLQITTRTALEIAATLTTGLFSPIFQQIDPMRLGEVSRAMSIGREYGQRLSRHGLDDEVLTKLIQNYPSHGFVIDRKEAGELFQSSVREPTDAEAAMARLTRPLAEAGLEDDAETIVEFLSVPLSSQQPQDGGNTNGENHAKITDNGPEDISTTPSSTPSKTDGEEAAP